MRVMFTILAVAVATAYAQDWRAATAKASRAVVHVEADDRACLRAFEARRKKASKEVLARIRIHQPYKLVVSGVAISDKGEILTLALHPRADLRVTVTFHDGVEEEATIIGTDPLSNLALIKVPVKTPDFLELGEAVKKDDMVALVGHDKARRAVSVPGPVLAPWFPIRMNDMYGVTAQREIHLASVFAVFTASATRPQVGAACIDAGGRLLGLRIGAMPWRQGNIDIALPASRIKYIVNAFRTVGRVIRSDFGIKLRDVSDTMREHFKLPASACSVQAINVPGPAERAGLKAHDVIVSVDGNAYPHHFLLEEAMWDKTPGKPVQFKVLRAGKKLTVPVTPRELR